MVCLENQIVSHIIILFYIKDEIEFRGNSIGYRALLATAGISRALKWKQVFRGILGKWESVPEKK